MISCPRNCGNKAIIDPLYGILPCAKCINEDSKKRKITKTPEFVSQTKQTRIQNQRDTHEGDMILPYTPKGEINEDYRRINPVGAKLAEDEIKRITGK